MVVDVRKMPRSRSNPQYNEDALPEALGHCQIGHSRISELGGLRGKADGIDPAVNGWWTNRSFHNYADYALSDAFVRGIEQLEALGAERRVAVMCSEAVWWRCHRRLIADYLIDRGHSVFHLMGVGRTEAASITPAAKRGHGHLVYPPADQG